MKEINNVPQHVAIIPDGNRRWAKKRKLQPWEGHDAGAQIIEEITKKARDIGIKYLSFWGSSEENLQKRSPRERRELIAVYEKYFVKLIKSEDIFTQKIRINVLGNWRTQLPQKLVRILEDGINKTKEHESYFINFFLAYSGDEEMLNAIRSIAQKFSSGKDITKETVKKHLLTKDLPSVDYMIRTGGEPHLSAGFMMWDIANAQLFFSEKYFPDFNEKEFEKAIKEYAHRKRRLGA